MGFNIVLVEPEIPNNTGNIGRLALATGCRLHLVRPFGFELSSSRLKRAGLDYWQHLEVLEYNGLDHFMDIHQNKKLALLSSHGAKPHWEITYEEDMFLIFGKESVGLPKKLLDTFSSDVFKIPMYSEHIRSLNLANAVAITVYEGLKGLR